MCVYIYFATKERMDYHVFIQRCKSRMQFFSNFEILFSRKLSLNVFGQKLGMQNAHPGEFFKFDFPGHEISSENNFIILFTFPAYFSHGMESKLVFSVPLAANISFFSSSSSPLIRSIRSFTSNTFHHSHIFEENSSKEIPYIDFPRKAIFDWQTRRYVR